MGQRAIVHLGLERVDTNSLVSKQSSLNSLKCFGKPVPIGVRQFERPQLEVYERELPIKQSANDLNLLVPLGATHLNPPSGVRELPAPTPSSEIPNVGITEWGRQELAISRQTR